MKTTCFHDICDWRSPEQLKLEFICKQLRLLQQIHFCQILTMPKSVELWHMSIFYEKVERESLSLYNICIA